MRLLESSLWYFQQYEIYSNMWFLSRECAHGGILIDIHICSIPDFFLEAAFRTQANNTYVPGSNKSMVCVTLTDQDLR